MKRYLKVIISALVLVLMVVAGCSSTKSPTVPSGSSGKPVDISFYFPVAVGGPITTLIETMVNDFNSTNPDVKVTPIFAGSYQETTTKVLTQMAGRDKPDVAVLSASELYTLTDQKALLPLNDLINKDADGKAFINDIYPAWMANSQIGETVYGIPFQRSTQVMYWNKDLFKKAGLDKAPDTWDEFVDSAKKITNAADGTWGIVIPSSGFPYWLFQGFAIQAGRNIMSNDGTEVFLNTPENIKAVEFFHALAYDHKVMPQGVIQWATAPTDFISGKVGMLFHTTGSLSNITRNAQFDLGVAMLPAGPSGRGTPTGGGNLHIFQGTSEERQQASWKFIRYLTTPEVQAQWTIDTGYVGIRKAVYETPLMKEFVAKNPNYLVARDQLQYAQGEFSIHNNQQVYKVWNDALQAVVTNQTPVKAALEKAQQDADAILKPFQKK